MRCNELNLYRCRCSAASTYVPVIIKNSEGVVKKEFTEVGLYNVESAILWVWRDVFLSLLSSKNSKIIIKMIPEFLAEVDDILGWRGLERLVAGGEMCSLLTLYSLLI